MSVTYIPERVKLVLWGKTAGLCEYDGCNRPLWIDPVTKAEFNSAYIAHIIADKPDGPRGDPELSEKLKSDFSNLMLLCDMHHRLVDQEDVSGHSVERLIAMKKKHEDRIGLVVSLQENKQSHVLLYGANIGQHRAPVSWKKAGRAMLPDWYPAEKDAIELSLKNSPFQDSEEDYWSIERESLRKQFAQSVSPKLASGTIEHFSIFALGPQPLLIELGRLLSDIPAAEVYQLHREPPDWVWQDNNNELGLILSTSEPQKANVALNLSLSATIDNSRITSVLGKNVTIWTLTVSVPHNDVLKSKSQLSGFRQDFRKALDRIKASHGQSSLLHLFPAVPVAVALEIGRVWMPKADLPLRIYDQNSKVGGFSRAFDLLND